MKKIKRFDELPNKIKVAVGGGKKLSNIDEYRRRFGNMNVYECKNKTEAYKIMKEQKLECMTLIDKDPMQGRTFFVALGLPGRKTREDFFGLEPSETLDTVLYFAELNFNEIKEVLRDEKSARKHYEQKARKLEKKNEHKKNR